jgi:exopolyphosphatase/guanosine-5'-triphosphate,3'-diphosphate pyrophosphatase
MRIAVIDCGTNTFHLLIAELTGGKWKFLVRKKMVVKLASGRTNPNEISPIAAARAIRIMQHYSEIIAESKVSKILTAGTAAFRDASNGTQLLRDIHKASGIKINVITGTQEALLICKGVCEAVPMNETPSLLMDIGGGSTEFIICNNKKILWKKSFRLGAARLLMEFNPADPFTRKDIKILNSFLQQQLQPLEQAILKFSPKQLIGASGSFETFASIILHRKGEERLLRTKTHYQFNMQEYKQLHQQLLHSTYAERLKIPGMLRMRADMIVMASLLLTFVLSNYRIKQLELSAFALKEGLLATALKK